MYTLHVKSNKLRNEYLILNEETGKIQSSWSNRVKAKATLNTLNAIAKDEAKKAVTTQLHRILKLVVSN